MTKPLKLIRGNPYAFYGMQTDERIAYTEGKKDQFNQDKERHLGIVGEIKKDLELSMYNKSPKMIMPEYWDSVWQKYLGEKQENEI